MMQAENPENACKKKWGHHSLETNQYSPEAHLHTAIRCPKNPGHANFIPVQEFPKHHLPFEFNQDDDCMEFISLLSDLTVHIAAGAISPDRPRVYPATADAFPFHITGGGYKLRSGSGFIRYLNQVVSTRENGEERSYWEVEVITAAHVVCDLIEVKDAKVRLFYDSTDSAPAILEGNAVVRADVLGDKCRFNSILADGELARKLYQKWRRCEDMRVKLWDKRQEWQQKLRREILPVVIISHPHGLAKHISIGRHVTWRDGSAVYDACTCPGCSGGLVTYLGQQIGLYDTFPHSGSLVTT